MNKLVANLGGGRGVAYLGAVVGVTASVAANYAHTFVTPASYDLAAPWYPSIGVRISAVFWPLALLLALEIIIRVPWPTLADAGAKWRWVTYQVIRWGGLSFVALVAAIVSYRHMSGLLKSYFEDPVTYTIGPLAIDGLMVMSAGALLLTRPQLRQTQVEPLAPVETVEPTEAEEPDGLAVTELPEPLPPPPAAPPVQEVPAAERDVATKMQGGQMRRARRQASNGHAGGTADAVRKALRSGPASIADLAKATGRNRQSVSYSLNETLKGEVAVDGRLWRLVEEVES